MYSPIVLRKSRFVKNKHPYIFQRAIKNHINIKVNSLLKVFDSDNNFLGIAIPVGGDVLKAVMIHFGEFADVLSEDYWNKKLQAIWERKRQIPFLKYTEAFRFLFAESDGVPGVIIDIYKKTAVISYKYEAMKRFQRFFVKFLLEKGIENVVVKSGQDTESLIGEVQNVIFKESDINFIAWINGGQKTGFFLDQFLNRRIFSEYVNKKSVLNVFSYTGAFSLYAMKSGAKKVVSVDSSTKAMDILKQNLKINEFPKVKHEIIIEDAFKFLQSNKEKYDVIVLDPPAFSKHKKTLPQALNAYKRLNKAAFNFLEKGGVLFTFSCSQVVKENDFYEVIMKAAKEAHVNINILHYLYQSPDHSISVNFPEGKYLKGLAVMRVD